MHSSIEDIASGIWACGQVAQRPDVVLSGWAVFELQLPGSAARTRHFAGSNLADNAGCASSAIVEFDPATWRGVTQGGRVYGLRGMPGFTPEGIRAWRRWLAANDVTQALDVTNGLLAMTVPK